MNYMRNFQFSIFHGLIGHGFIWIRIGNIRYGIELSRYHLIRILKTKR